MQETKKRNIQNFKKKLNNNINDSNTDDEKHTK